MADWSGVLARTASYYASKAGAHGATPAGVDWSSGASQQRRFDQFARLLGDENDASINDYGCGHGALVEWPIGAAPVPILRPRRRA